MDSDGWMEGVRVLNTETSTWYDVRHVDPSIVCNTDETHLSQRVEFTTHLTELRKEQDPLRV